MTPTIILDELEHIAASVSGWDAVQRPGSPQRKALGWLSTVDHQNEEIFPPKFVQR
eukprot:CAMPEP_0116856814 /NCGR_PEP_ID=MMETSP0418-20121206/20155_1 /TAXON_ID=1158023 /ORGANISM="Astrosyne radiata, Strain 13vi08-1A" /LENGTH=55 /DNA_ID=CAMNT_0004490325 /DNA_START=42 /DNA_END=206 /DNA_ORIENTATION=+